MGFKYLLPLRLYIAVIWIQWNKTEKPPSTSPEVFRLPYYSCPAGDDLLTAVIQHQNTYNTIEYINACYNKVVRENTVSIISDGLFFELCFCAVEFPEKITQVNVTYHIKINLTQNCGIEFRTDRGSRFSCRKGKSIEAAFKTLTISRTRNYAIFATLQIDFGTSPGTVTCGLNVTNTDNEDQDGANDIVTERDREAQEIIGVSVGSAVGGAGITVVVLVYVYCRRQAPTYETVHRIQPRAEHIYAVANHSFEEETSSRTITVMNGVTNYENT